MQWPVSQWIQTVKGSALAADSWGISELVLRRYDDSSQLFVSPVFNLRRIGRVEGQTLRYPAGRPIHGLFVIVFPVLRSGSGSVSSLNGGGAASRVPVPGIPSAATTHQFMSR